MYTKSELIGYVLAGILVLLILFSQPTLVGGDVSYVLCGGKGYINGSDGMCSCLNGYYGRNCDLSELLQQLISALFIFMIEI